jgi:arsenate reductase
MKKIYHLPNCDTCRKIIVQLNKAGDFELQNIKDKNISAEELDALAEKAGSYEALFSRKAMKYRSLGLHDRQLTETEYRDFILEEYTFVKRPFIIIDDEIFIGNAKETLEAARTKLSQI